MKLIRMSNLAAVIAAMGAAVSQMYPASQFSDDQRANQMRRWERTAMRRHYRMYGSGPRIKPGANSNEAQRRRRHIAEGRYTPSQILKAA